MYCMLPLRAGYTLIYLSKHHVWWYIKWLFYYIDFAEEKKFYVVICFQETWYLRFFLVFFIVFRHLEAICIVQILPQGPFYTTLSMSCLLIIWRSMEQRPSYHGMFEPQRQRGYERDIYGDKENKIIYLHIPVLWKCTIPLYYTIPSVVIMAE